MRKKTLSKYEKYKLPVNLILLFSRENINASQIIAFLLAMFPDRTDKHHLALIGGNVSKLGKYLLTYLRTRLNIFPSRRLLLKMTTTSTSPPIPLHHQPLLHPVPRAPGLLHPFPLQHPLQLLPTAKMKRRKIKKGGGSDRLLHSPSM